MDASANPALARPPRPVMTASAVICAIAAAAILTALAFEHFGGYAPCPLCLEERYAYYFGVPASANVSGTDAAPVLPNSPIDSGT